MNRQAVSGHLGLWKAKRPRALVSPVLRRPHGNAAVLVHRRVFLGIDTRPIPGLTFPRQTWTALRWLRTGRYTESPAQFEENLRAYATATGAPVAVLRERIRSLQLNHGIPPTDALLFGLTRDGHLNDWPLYVYSVEAGWNVSASAVVLGSTRRAQRDSAVLDDKLKTAEILRDAGLPVVPSLIVESATELSPTVEQALAEWGAIFIKPRKGSRGSGAMIATREADRVLVRTYAQGGVGSEVALSDVTSDRPLLVQPLLASPSWNQAEHDIVTVRIVTRQMGRRPVVFSQILEFPQTPGYSLHAVGEGGLGADIFTPITPEGRGVAPPAEINLAIDPSITEMAIRAHEMFPGLFAVAWDVALTHSGPVFLEGNVGFGVQAPQMVAGGLLAGL